MQGMYNVFAVFLAVLFTLALAGCQNVMTEESADAKPNIIFIMVDDMGYADLGCYGSDVIHTPNLDRMAAEGIKFTQAYSGCTVCAPARSTLMTGKHMGHTALRGNTGGIPLPPAETTVAEVLKKAGYATGGFGKWGLGDLNTAGVPENQGFDRFYGYYHQIHAHSYYPDYLIDTGKKVPLPGNQGDRQTQYTHDLIFAETIKFIRKNKDRPFFCYAAWTPPHGHYEIPADEPAWAMYKDKDWPRKARVIAAMDTMIDRQVGEIFALLKELGIDGNTVVFFCSDNGAAERYDGILDASGPLRGRKRSPYEGGVRVPMIVRWPGKITPGAVSDLQWYFPDVMPTLAELAGAADYVPADIDGISVVPTLTGNGEQPTHECLYWEWQRYDWGKKQPIEHGLMQGVRCGDWKMARRRTDQPWELYDLADDIGETTNLADQRPDIVRKMDAWVKQNRTDPPPQIEPEMPAGKLYR